jgi:transposase
MSKRRWAKTIAPRRFVFVDESGAHLAMGRSHAWLPRGAILVEPRPMNWGDNLTMIGAMRLAGWVTLGTCWGAVNTEKFTDWVRRRLAPRLRRGDVVVLDNLPAHKARAVRDLIEARGAAVQFLPPYSHELNPIESAWGLVKKRIRATAPRVGRALRRAAHKARRAVRPRHCQGWYAHAGY